ncbi:MAG: hypothetical protein HQK53_01480 [Oligoflexia bacterium]|nr:hypothetical protein [Oligoflexia bacterium]
MKNQSNLFMLYKYRPKEQFFNKASNTLKKSGNDSYHLLTTFFSGENDEFVDKAQVKKYFNKIIPYLRNEKDEIKDENNERDKHIEYGEERHDEETAKHQWQFQTGHDADTEIGPFRSLEELHQFTSELIKKLKLDKATLISVHDYNQCLEKTAEIKDFKNSLIAIGKEIVNSSSLEQTGNNLLKKFFLK